MKKKILSVLLLVALAALCLAVFSGCRNSTADFFNYSEKDLGLIGKLVFWMHKGIKNYGWTVVVFTVCLKVLMLPLEFWQRYSARKSSLKMQKIQPLMEAIDKRYGANTQRANEEKQKLYKKQGYSMASMCLPMILSMVIFFVMFGGLRNYSMYSSVKSFQDLSGVYHQTFVEQIRDNDELVAKIEGNAEFSNVFKVYDQAMASESAKDVLNAQTDVIGAAKTVDATTSVQYEKAALEAVQDWYENHHESWLWIQNVWQPDTWAPIMQPYEGNSLSGGGFRSSGIYIEGYHGDAEALYKLIRGSVLETGGYGKNGNWNGLMILPILSIGLSFLSNFISQLQEKKNRKGEVAQQNQQQATTNKMMMILMPLMMAWFGFIYTGAFAIYMVVNYTISILTTLALRIPVEKAVLKKLDQEDSQNKSTKASYMR